MNYLYLKKRFPKSITKFFYWVTEKNPDNHSNYVDNFYFYQFFSEYFEYRISDYNNYYNSLIIDYEKRYFKKLKNDLIIKSRKENSDYFRNGKIIYNQYSDTGEDYLKINIEKESDFESAFFVLETLIENKFYVG